MKLTKQDTDLFHRVLVSGLSGTGKSTLVAELATQFDVIWIDLENAKDVLTKLPAEALARIQYISLPDSASFPIAVQTLMVLFKTGKAIICNAHGKHDCAICKKAEAPVDELDITNLPVTTILVVDTITQLAASILAYTCKDKPIEYRPERDDWGALRRYSEYFASQFQAYKGNLVCTCHAIEAELEDGKTKLVPAFGSKDMSSKIAKSFGDVIYCDTKNKRHVAYSSSLAANNLLTKSRADFVIEALPVPSLIPLFLNSHLTEEHKEQAALQDKSPADNAVSNLSKLLLKPKS